MDMAPRRGASGTSAVVAARPVSKSAGDLHSRVKPAHVLDLRASEAPEPAKAEKPVAAAIVHPARHTPAPLPKSTAHERHEAEINGRLSQAKQYARSAQINKFAGQPAQSRLLGHRHEPVAVGASAAAAAVVSAAKIRSAGPELPALAATHHEAMTRLAPPVAAAAETQPAAAFKPAGRSHLALSPHSGRVLATAAAVVLMAGYVWVQNYPKLALQAASSKAGLAASLPGYVPSSYNLAHTDTAPGVVTLSFSSPSVAGLLKIAQTRTTWDSSSLLDNFVAKKADDYATVQAQGLTIYLFNNNQATWVNHGTWYSIEGAAKLSREQILKIAYSL